MGTRGVVTEVTGFFGGHLIARLDGGVFGVTTVRMRAAKSASFAAEVGWTRLSDSPVGVSLFGPVPP